MVKPSDRNVASLPASSTMGLRPTRKPLARRLAIPARTLSRMRSRSNSAIAEMIPNINRPAGVVRSSDSFKGSSAFSESVRRLAPATNFFEGGSTTWSTGESITLPNGLNEFAQWGDANYYSEEEVQKRRDLQVQQLADWDTSGKRRNGRSVGRKKNRMPKKASDCPGAFYPVRLRSHGSWMRFERSTLWARSAVVAQH